MLPWSFQTEHSPVTLVPDSGLRSWENTFLLLSHQISVSCCSSPRKRRSTARKVCMPGTVPNSPSELGPSWGHPVASFLSGRGKPQLDFTLPTVTRQLSGKTMSTGHLHP